MSSSVDAVDARPSWSALAWVASLLLGLGVVPSAHALDVEFLETSYDAVAGGTVSIGAVASASSPAECVAGEPFTYRFNLNGITVRDYSTDATFDLELFFLDSENNVLSIVDGPSVNTLSVTARCPEPPQGVGIITSQEATATLNVANGAVTIDAILTNGTTDHSGLTEASGIVFSADWTDADRGFDTHTFTWVIDGGDPITGEFANVGLDDGEHTIELSIDDNEGSVATKSLTFDVANVVPTISSFSVPANGQEGASMLLSANVSDPFDDLSVTWTVAGQEYQGRQVNWIPPNQGSWLVELEVDDGTDIATRTATTNVVNVPPVVANARRVLDGGAVGSLTEIDEGTTVQLAVDATDIVDVVTVSWLMPDGAELDGLTPTWVAGNQVTGNATVIAEDDVVSASTNAFVRVRNVPPTITGVNVPTAVDEGDTATLSATAIDPFDTLTYEWELNGQIYTGQSVDIPFNDPGTALLTLSVIDDEVSVSQQVEVEVGNVPPSVDATVSPTSPDEGEQATISVVASDVGGGSLQYIYDYGDGTDIRTTGQSTVQHTWADSGSYTLTVKARDNKGGEGTEEVEVVVNNLPPTLTDVFAPGGFEGVAMTFRAAGTDPGADTLTYTWDFGDGTAPATGSEVTHTYADSGTFDVTVTLDDGDGGQDSEVVEVLVRNLAPTLSALSVTGDVREEGVVQFSLTATDVPDDPVTFHWDFGDGFTDTTSVGEYTYSWPDDGVYTVVVLVEDDEGLGSSRQTVLDVVNLPPVVTSFYVAEDPPGTPMDPTPGVPVPFGASATDVAADVLTYTWTFGDGSPEFEGATGTHTYSTDGVYTVTVEIRDDDGGVTRRSDTIPVGDVEIALDPLETPDPIDEGGSVEIVATAVSFLSRPLTYTWDPGDGSPTVTGETFQHTYADDGTFTANLTVSDGTNTVMSSVDVVVNNVVPQLGAVSLPDAADEGDVVTFAFPATDPGDDTLVWTWIVDGQVQPVIADTFDLTVSDDGSVDVEVMVDDGDGGIVTDAVTLQVANVAPTGVISGDADDSNGQTLEFTVAITEPGDDSVRVDWDYGDGFRIFDTTSTVTHTYSRNGTFTVQVTLRDEDGGVSSATWQVVIDGIGPVVSEYLVPTATDEGRTVELRCSGFDRGASGGFDILWDMGNGDTREQGYVNYAWPDDGTFQVSCTVTDLDGREDVRTSEIVIANIAPTFGLAPSIQVAESATYTYNPLISDPGDDTITFEFTLPAGASGNPTTGVVTWATPPNSVGNYPMEIIARDEDGGESTMAWTLQVILVDADGDLLPDPWETANGFDTTGNNNANGDPDGDGRTNMQEYLGGTNPRSDDRPSTPVPVEPVGLEEVASAEPDLIWETSVSPVDDPLTYEVQVFPSAAPITPVTAVTGVTATGDEGSWQVDVVLDENRGYYWRVRAYDGFGYSPWTNVEGLIVNAVEEAPGAPVLYAPVDLDEVDTLRPTLQATPSPDPDGDAFTLTIVVEDSNNTVVAQGSGLVPSAGRVSWTVDVDLTEGETYTWYAFATDATGLDSALSTSRMFTTETFNAAPSAPTITAPLDGVTVDQASPTIVVTNGVDPEGDPLRVTFQVDSSPAFDNAPIAATVAAGTGGTTSWAVAGSLAENATYYIRVRMVEQFTAAASPWDEISVFISEENDPPGQVELVSPADLFEAVTGEATLEITEVTDPDSTVLVYDIEVLSGTTVVDEILSAPATGTGTVTWTVTGLQPGTYLWQGRAVDDGGRPGPWSEQRTLIVPTPEDTDPPDTETETETETEETDDTGESGLVETGGTDGGSDSDCDPETDKCDTSCGGCSGRGAGAPAQGMILVLLAVGALRRRRES